MLVYYFTTPYFTTLLIIGGGELLGGFGAELLHFYGVVHEVAFAGFEFIQGTIVVFTRLVEIIVNVLEVFDKSRELVEHFAGFFGNLHGVLVLAFAGPELVDEFDAGDEVCGADDDHIALVGILPEVVVGLHGLEVGGLVGDEEHDKVGSVLHPLFVALGLEFIDVPLHRVEMFFEMVLAQLLIFFVSPLGVSGE